MDFMAGGCDMIHGEDPRAMCVVGPAPYYKIWEFSGLTMPSGQLRQNIMYTFDFFIPKVFVESNSANYVASDDEAPTFPGMYSCKEGMTVVKEHDSKDGEVKVDAIFLKHIMRDIPVAVTACMRPVLQPVGCEGRSRQARGTTEVCHSVAGRLCK